MANNKLFEDNKKKLSAATKEIRAYIDTFIDAASFVETDVFLSGKSFIDGSDALGEGVLTGYGAINGRPVAIIAQNLSVLGGSFSRAGANKMLKCIKNAINKDIPLISILDSRGARLGEGVAMLEGYAEVIALANELKAYVPHIAVIKGNAVGLAGVYASTADFIYMCKDSVMSFGAPQNVICASNKIGKSADFFGVDTLSKTSTLATFTYESSTELASSIDKLLSYISEAVIESDDNPNRTSAKLNKNVNTLSVLEALCDDSNYLELYANFATPVKTMFATINSLPVGIVALNVDGKGGKLCKTCMKKIKKFVKLVDSYDLPLITIVDSDGVHTSIEFEQNGLALSACKLFTAISSADVTKIAVITGKAIGFSYVALCSKGAGFEYTLAFPNAVIAPVSAELAMVVADKTIELKNAKDPIKAREELKAKFEAENDNPFVSGKDGYIDNIIEPALIRPYIANALTTLVK